MIRTAARITVAASLAGLALVGTAGGAVAAPTPAAVSVGGVKWGAELDGVKFGRVDPRDSATARRATAPAGTTGNTWTRTFDGIAWK